MAKCPFGHRILSDAWVKKEGASLMGKSAKGKAKRRKNAQEAARMRWDQKPGIVPGVPGKVRPAKKKRK
jgi:hypothetical protein